MCVCVGGGVFVFHDIRKFTFYYKSSVPFLGQLYILLVYLFILYYYIS